MARPNPEGGNRLKRILETQWMIAVFSILMFGRSMCIVASAQERASRTEEITWTWEVRPAHVDPKLPNVLLLGDSITRNYYPEVQRQLAAAANVYLMATSASVGDPRLLRQLTDYSTAEPIAFSVVHFNNGLHGWEYSEAEYRESFSSFIAALHAMAPRAALVWATTTPVGKESEPGPTNARINARNNIAQLFIRADGIAVDVQHGLMAQHADLYLDGVHYDEKGSNLQGKQAADAIRSLLPHSEH
jgi:hypothetical protein